MKKFNDYRITIKQEVNSPIVNQEIFDSYIKEQNSMTRKLVETICNFRRVKIITRVEYGDNVGIPCDRLSGIHLVRLFVTNVHTDMYFRSSDLGIVKAFVTGFRRELCKDGHSENEVKLFVKKKK